MPALEIVLQEKLRYGGISTALVDIDAAISDLELEAATIAGLEGEDDELDDEEGEEAE